MTMQQYKIYEGKGIDSIKLESVSKPTLKSPTDVLIKIHALSLNARDPQFANGTYALPMPKEGTVVTSDAAGEVVQIGDEVTKFQLGDRVSPIPMPGFHTALYPTTESMGKGIGFTGDGTAQEYLVVDQSDLVNIPSHMTYAQAATLPIACGTAWSVLYGATKQLKAGDTVICMGTGGVAVFVAAIALISGARVIMTSSSDKKLDEVRAHLANLITTPGHFLGINRREHREWDKQVAKLTNGELGDFLLEIGGMKTLPSSIRSVKQGGLVGLTGYLSNDEGGDENENLVLLLMLGGAIVRGILCCNRNDTIEMNSALELAQYRPLINKVFPFGQLKDAYEYMLSGDHLGKIVVNLVEGDDIE